MLRWACSGVTYPTAECVRCRLYKGSMYRERRLPRLGRDGPSALMDEFDLEDGERAFRPSIAVEITGAAHRGRGAIVQSPTPDPRAMPSSILAGLPPGSRPARCRTRQAAAGKWLHVDTSTCSHPLLQNRNRTPVAMLSRWSSWPVCASTVENSSTPLGRRYATPADAVPVTRARGAPSAVSVSGAPA